MSHCWCFARVAERSSRPPVVLLRWWYASEEFSGGDTRAEDLGRQLLREAGLAARDRKRKSAGAHTDSSVKFVRHDRDTLHELKKLEHHRVRRIFLRTIKATAGANDMFAHL